MSTNPPKITISTLVVQKSWLNIFKNLNKFYLNFVQEGLCKEDEADVDYLTLFREYSQFANDPAVDEAPNNTDTITKDNVANEPAAEPKQSEVAVDAGFF